MRTDPARRRDHYRLHPLGVPPRRPTQPEEPVGVGEVAAFVGGAILVLLALLWLTTFTLRCAWEAAG